MSVTAVDFGAGSIFDSRNAEAELLDDLKDRGYELWVEDGRLKFRGPPATPVIEQAMRANVRGLKRLLDKSVTVADSPDVSIVNSRNAQVELIKNRNDKRLFHKLVAPAVEEAKRDFVQASAVVKRQQEAGEFSDPGEGLWRVLEEYSKHTPPEVREARRLAAEARKTAEVCGFCGRDIEDGEPVHFG